MQSLLMFWCDILCFMGCCGSDMGHIINVSVSFKMWDGQNSFADLPTLHTAQCVWRVSTQCGHTRSAHNLQHKADRPVGPSHLARLADRWRQGGTQTGWSWPGTDLGQGDRGQATTSACLPGNLSLVPTSSWSSFAVSLAVSFEYAMMPLSHVKTATTKS